MWARPSAGVSIKRRLVIRPTAFLRPSICGVFNSRRGSAVSPRPNCGLFVVGASIEWVIAPIATAYEPSLHEPSLHEPSLHEPSLHEPWRDVDLLRPIGTRPDQQCSNPIFPLPIF